MNEWDDRVIEERRLEDQRLQQQRRDLWAYDVAKLSADDDLAIEETLIEHMQRWSEKKAALCRAIKASTDKYHARQLCQDIPSVKQRAAALMPVMIASLHGKYGVPFPAGPGPGPSPDTASDLIVINLDTDETNVNDDRNCDGNTASTSKASVRTNSVACIYYSG